MKKCKIIQILGSLLKSTKYDFLSFHLFLPKKRNVTETLQAIEFYTYSHVSKIQKKKFPGKEYFITGNKMKSRWSLKF